mmetsp:Transcript_26070/g.54659  ORF Transcript_26070/g.54659 Transcript_26070/m.54659 type:complete len:93 (+) Transcript_26070:355-633(+)
MSAQIFCFERGTSTPSIKTSSNDLFNEYIKPLIGAVWSQNAISIHGISPDYEKIRDASKIEDVWSNFCSFIDDCVSQMKWRFSLLITVGVVI